MRTFLLTMTPTISFFYMTTKSLADAIDSMSDTELVANMRQTVKDLRENNVNGSSLGAAILRDALRRSTSKRAEASRKNGRLGGRPKGSRNKKTIAKESAEKQSEEGTAKSDVQKRTEKALKALIEYCPSASTPKPIKRPTAPPKQSRKPYQKSVYTLPKRQTPLPRSAEEVQDIVYKCNLDGDDAYQWWQMTMVERHGHDRYGNPILNWPGALIRFCEAKAASRAV